MAPATCTQWIVVLCVCMTIVHSDRLFTGTQRAFSLNKVHEAGNRHVRSADDLTSLDSMFARELGYKMDIDGHGTLDLHLVTNRHSIRRRSAVRPVRPMGYRTREPGENAPPMAIYTDQNGHGSFACERHAGHGRETDCIWSGLVTVGDETCYIGSHSEVADCSQTTDGFLQYYDVPEEDDVLEDEDDQLYSSDIPSDGPVPRRMYLHNNRHRRSILPDPGHKTVELAFILDKGFMDLFYERHPGDSDAAELEVETYMTLLTNEMNIYMSTLKEDSAGELDIYVYPSAIIHPDEGENFGWSESFSSDDKLDVGGGFNNALHYFMKTNFTEVQYDHAIAITGYNLFKGKSYNLLGYSFLGSVCRKTSYRYSLIEFTQFNIGWIASHELGHALGAPNDGPNGCESEKYLMSGKIFKVDDTNKDTYYAFSNCSITSIKDHLNSYNDCLSTDNGFTEADFNASFCSGLMGRRSYTLNKQCQRATGWADSRVCSGQLYVSEGGCYDPSIVQCRTPDKKCSKRLRWVWNGTPCGQGKICYKGECIDSFSVCGLSTPPPISTTTIVTTSTTTTTEPTTTTTTTEPTTSTTTTEPTTTTTTEPTTTTTTTEPTTTTTTTEPTTTTTTTTEPTTTTTTTEPTTTTTTTEPTTTTTTTEPTTTTTTQLPTTSAFPPCTCCGRKKKKKCCNKGKKKYKTDCYCCNGVGEPPSR